MTTKLKQLMDSRGMKSKWLADKLGISPSLLYLYREGTRIPGETLLNMAEILDVNPRDLLGNVERSRKQEVAA